MRKSTSRKILRLLIPILLILAMIACSQNAVNRETGGPLTAVDKASIVADELTKQYEFLHRSITDIMNTGSVEQKTWISTNVADPMNKVKEALIQYNQMVILWREGGLMPSDMYEREKFIRETLQTVLLLFMKGGE